jgi:hypothetical protein
MKICTQTVISQSAYRDDSNSHIAIRRFDDLDGRGGLPVPGDFSKVSQKSLSVKGVFFISQSVKYRAL